MTPAVLLAALLVAPTDTLPPSQTFTLDSRATGEPRVINVYTPPGYDAAGRRRYPVLYMPDGGMQEDFPHVVVTVDSLIRLGRIPATLVVGVENTQRRRDMTGPTRIKSDSAIAPVVGGSAVFRQFWKEELIPEIERRYRVNADRAIIGESLAGLFIVETMLLEPSLFHRYIALSPSLWWNDDALLRIVPERIHAFRVPMRIYLSSAGEPGIAPQTDTLATLLTRRRRRRIHVTYHPRPDLTHNTIYLGESPAALVEALR
ncbi:MAG TPA: alpha/beta hydrolase-fold protein [Gemmatimonadales bacterium]|nr:alpha/beta hydrolase-fold protein [Gemmatimonadales bacterium]